MLKCKECKRNFEPKRYKKKGRNLFCSRLCSKRNWNRKYRNRDREHYNKLQREAYTRLVIRQSAKDIASGKSFKSELWKE